MVVLVSVLTCPSCGVQATESMPESACLYFYECTGCGERLKPRAGDCCVFCSYGTVVCPPMQTDGGRPESTLAAVEDAKLEPYRWRCCGAIETPSAWSTSETT
ncbi:MAG: GDCCVxC domain-containing (seleno)protein [Sciscionella sp.]